MSDNFERFIITQAAVIIRNNKCLILQFCNSKKWGLPGGRIEKGETGKKTLARELKEELGIDNYEYLGVADYDFYYYQSDGEMNAKCNLFNLIENGDDKIKISNNEHSDFKWIEENEINEFEFAWPNMERVLKNCFKYKRLLEK